METIEPRSAPGALRRGTRRGALTAGLTLGVTCALAYGLPELAAAHGGTTSPPQRTYVCRFLEPESQPCRDARAANPQALYDWMEVNIADANGRHRELIPDGQLCSAGREKFAAFDAPTDAWPAAVIRPGRRTIEYSATAPHATRYFRYYITREGFDASRPLRWSDLVEIYDSGPRAAAATYTFSVDVPERTGRHILYGVWQRSDSPEAFYSCSDVRFDGDGDGPEPPPVEDPPPGEDPPPPVEEPPPPPREEPSGTPRIALTTTSDWGGGYCADATVTNPDHHPMAWEAAFPLGGRVTSAWNATLRADGTTAHATGAAWNATLAPGASTTFGFCADRAAAPTPPPAPTPTPTPTPPAPAPRETVRVARTITSDWGSGYCASVTVTNDASSAADWQVAVPAEGRLTSLWNAVGEQAGSELRVRGASWNARLAPGASTDFGFCAGR